MSSKRGRPRKAIREPHNARPRPDYESLTELIESVATEERRVPFRGREVMMTRRECGLRIMIEKALEGKTRELAQLLKWMARYPDVLANEVIVIVMRGKICDV